ncbi:MAG: hypothetical protein MUO78_02015 [candidate division Zixibacteria bacterium]|nr:hypothetical protein [candidate division Zixibacteria bacterium]
MSYINPITCENAWLSFEDILRLLYKDGYLGAYGNVGNTYHTLYYTEGGFLSVIWRKDMRAGILYLDKTLSPLGFAGTENTDWENVKIYI